MPGLPFSNLPATQQEIPFGQSGSMTLANPQQQSPPQQRNTTTATSIIEGEIELGQRQINLQFDQAKYELDQQVYKNPEDYINAINELKGKAAQAGLQLRQKAEAKLYSLNQVLQLVKEGSMPKEAGQRAAYRIAGLSNDQVDAMFPEEKPRNLISEHAAIVGELKRVDEVLRNFAYDKKGVLYYSKDPKGGSDEPDTKRGPVPQEEVETYLYNKRVEDFIQDQEQEIFEQMTPGAKTAIAGQMAAEKRKMAIPKPPSPLWGLSPILGLYKINKYKKQLSKIAPVGTLDENTARKILTEAGGNKEKARQLAKERGYTF